MASPSQTQGSAPATQPVTPPAESSAPNGASGASAPTTSQAPAAVPATAPVTSTALPTNLQGTSLQDSGKTRRPRDVRLVHMLLASLGVTAYQDRVPLQLLDFAYRYTSNVLQDAVHLGIEGYAGAVAEGSGTGSGKNSASAEVGSVSLNGLRLSIASRLHYQFQTGLPKEFLMDVASERNRIALPGVSRGFDAGTGAPNGAAANAANQSVMVAGMRLPPERFCLTGTGWNMKDEWDSEGEEEDEMPGVQQQAGAVTGAGEEGEEGEEGGNDDDDGKMEDVFGEDTAMGEAGEGDEDQKMNDA